MTFLYLSQSASKYTYVVKIMVLAGETLLEVQQRLLKEREMKIRTALEKLRRKRHLLRAQRQQKEFPVVSVLGYTNCGECRGDCVLNSRLLFTELML